MNYTKPAFVDNLFWIGGRSGETPDSHYISTFTLPNYSASPKDSCELWVIRKSYEPRDDREEGPEKGLFSGERGEFVIHRKEQEQGTVNKN